MPRAPSLAHTLIAIGLTLATVSSALAQEMVSVKGSTLNMRAEPSTRSAVLWELKKGYPLKVLKRKGDWLQVRDFENDTGWVARAYTGKTPYLIVKAPVANIRKGPGTGHGIVGKAEYGELLRTAEKRRDWVRVRRADGKPGGWVFRRLVWGF